MPFPYQEHCHVCAGGPIILGVLGTVEHCRCRDCGAQWSRPAPEDDDELED